jgi:hypothetical protein
MGSWAVYCGISNIAITSGQECIFLPLKKSKNNEYLPYLPATLPIFGEYDDYGGIENIVHDENTKLICEHFGCSIDQFCEFLTRGPDDEEGFPKFLKAKEEMNGWTYMWIDRKVYDFMSSYSYKGYDGAGYLEYGNPKILELLGFTYIGENEKNDTYDPKRYKYQWEYQDKKFGSDGTWLHCGKESIFNFEKEQYNGLLNHISLPEDKMWIGEKTMPQLWRHLKRNKQEEQLLWIIDRDRFASMRSFLGNQHIELKTLVDKYSNEIRTFGDRLAELVMIHKNLHCMSGYFQPFQ